MGTFTTQLKSWKSGLNSQIKAIRTVTGSDNIMQTGSTLADDMTQLLGTGQHGWSNVQVRSWNAAMQREIKRAAKAAKIEEFDVYSLTMNKEKTEVIFGKAAAASNKKEKCPMLQAIAKLKAEKKDTPEAVKTIVTLIESYIAAE